MYPSYKSNRSPTPDTIVQGLQFLKASLKAMSIKVIEVRFVEHWVKDQSSKIARCQVHQFLQQVPGVEADDVIGTLAVRSVDAGFKVNEESL